MSQGETHQDVTQGDKSQFNDDEVEKNANISHNDDDERQEYQGSVQDDHKGSIQGDKKGSVQDDYKGSVQDDYRGSAQEDYKGSIQEDPIFIDDSLAFMTQQRQEDYIWKCFDFLFPAGKLAKLSKQFPYSDILTKLKLDDGYPVVNFIGARHDFEAKKEAQRGKFYAGIARACFNTDAVILDNSVTTGVERFGLRRGLKIIGVAPEGEIQFPKLNPTSQNKHELSNGHTHMFLLNNLEKNLKWGGESVFKIQLCKKIAEGKHSKTKGRPRCRIVNILFLDDTECLDEIREAVINKMPLIIVKGSPLCDRYIEKKQMEEEEKANEIKKIEDQKKSDEKHKNEEKKKIEEQSKSEEPKKEGDESQEQPQAEKAIPEKAKPIPAKAQKPEQPKQKKEQIQEVKAPYDDPKYLYAEFDDIINDPDAHVYYLDSLNSEEIAQFVHFFLTYTPY